MTMRSPGTTTRRLRVGHLHVDQVTFFGALDAIESMVASRGGGIVFTPNVDHVVLADEDERFREAYARADLSLVDGMPLVWVSHLLGVPLPEKISGSDLAFPLLERGESKGWRVYLLGGAPGVAAQAAERLRSRLPRIVIVGAEGPAVDMGTPAASRTELIARIGTAKADLVLVALGAPKQELWIAEASPALRPAVLIGIGAAIDFIAGTAQRAPSWVSASGFEWLYRLSREPRRLWKRYLLRDPKFIAILVRELMARTRDRANF